MGLFFVAPYRSLRQPVEMIKTTRGLIKTYEHLEVNPFHLPTILALGRDRSEVLCRKTLVSLLTTIPKELV
jgi:hypothetical protein